MKGFLPVSKLYFFAVLGFVLFLSSCTKNPFVPNKYEMEEYPGTWEPMVTADKGGCPDISGRYYSSQELFSIVMKMLNEEISKIPAPDTIEFKRVASRKLNIRGYDDWEGALFDDKVTFACNAGFVSVLLQTQAAGSFNAYEIAYGTESAKFGITRSHQLVVELSDQAIGLIGLFYPVIGGESHWFKIQPVESEPIADIDSLLDLGRESLPGSRRQFVWYCRAAHKGNPTAMFLLASRFYEKAETQNSTYRINAYFWYSLAMSSGDRDAASRVVKLREKMSRSEVTNAEQQLKGWKPDAAVCGEKATELNLS